MDVFAELLPASHLIKTETTAKDKQQQSQYQKAKAIYQQVESEKTNLTKTKPASWDDIDRRSGIDRRLTKQNRGKWLESRAEKDRRQLAEAIFVKI